MKNCEKRKQKICWLAAAFLAASLPLGSAVLSAPVSAAELPASVNPPAASAAEVSSSAGIVLSAGDVDGDGRITLLDRELLLQQQFFGTPVAQSGDPAGSEAERELHQQASARDLDEDGYITMKDLQILMSGRGYGQGTQVHLFSDFTSAEKDLPNVNTKAAFSVPSSSELKAARTVSGNALGLELEFYRYLPGNTSGTPRERWGDPIDLESDTLSGGEAVVAAVKYSNLSALNANGLAGFGVQMKYDFSKFEPMYLTDGGIAVTNPAILMSTDAALLNAGLIPTPGAWSADAYQFGGSDKPMDENNRLAYFRIVMQQQAAQSQPFGAGSDEGYLGFLPFQAREVTSSGSAAFALLDDDMLAVDLFTGGTSTLAEGDAVSGGAVIRSLGENEIQKSGNGVVASSTVKITPGENGTLSGTVQTWSLKGMHTATVSVYENSAGIQWEKWGAAGYASAFSPVQTMETTSDGAFSFTLPSGPYDLLIKKPGYLDFVITGVQVKGGKEVTIE